MEVALNNKIKNAFGGGDKKGFKWDNQFVKQAVELFNSDCDYSTAVIGEKLGVSKNTVVGIINRYRQMNPEGVKFKKNMIPKVKAKSPTPRLKVIQMPQSVTWKPKRMRLRLIEDPRNVTLADLDLATMCRFPLGDPRQPDFRYCGASRDGNAVYCYSHCQLVYRAPDQRSQSKPYYRR